MDLKQRISIVLLMARLECPTLVKRVITTEGWPVIPSEVTINSIYKKFCEFGTVLDLPRSGRPKISDEESTCEILEILAENPQSTLTQISAATNISRSTI